MLHKLYKICGCHSVHCNFMFSKFHWLDLHNKTCVSLANRRAFASPLLGYMMNHQQKADWKSDILWYSDGYWKCMIVDSLCEYISRPSCVHYWVWSSQQNLMTYSNLFQSCVFMVFVFHPHLTTPIKHTVGVQLRKVLKLHPWAL